MFLTTQISSCSLLSKAAELKATIIVDETRRCVLESFIVVEWPHQTHQERVQAGARRAVSHYAGTVVRLGISFRVRPHWKSRKVMAYYLMSTA